MNARRDLERMPPARDARAAKFRPNGELRLGEWIFRFGLLAASSAMMLAAMGAPWNRGAAALAAAFFLALLIVLTLAFQWRVLGDWRRDTQRAILAALCLALTIPLAAVLNPRLGGTALPSWLEIPLGQTFSALEKIPGLGAALALLKGVLLFAFYIFILCILLLTTGAARRGGAAFLALAISALALFFHPTLETAVGLLLLGYFFVVQWEHPLMIPDKIMAHLSPDQIEFMRELAEQGSLSTGETRLHLQENAAAFSQLAEFGLVEYDSIAREVVPGARLRRDPSSDTLERMFAWARRGVWILAGLIYLVLPDLLPGPIDDMIILFLCSGAGLGWFANFFPRRAGRRPPRE